MTIVHRDDEVSPLQIATGDATGAVVDAYSVALGGHVNAVSSDPVAGAEARTSRLRSASANGLQQMLPVQTNRTFTDHGSTL